MMIAWIIVVLGALTALGNAHAAARANSPRVIRVLNSIVSVLLMVMALACAHRLATL